MIILNSAIYRLQIAKNTLSTIVSEDKVFLLRFGNLISQIYFAISERLYQQKTQRLEKYSMIHGLSDYEKIKVIRPLPEGYLYDQFHMPIMKKVSETELDFQRLKALNIQNLSNRYDNSDKLILPFSYDKSLLRYWNNPLKYIPLLQTVMAAGTPDYSAYPTMNPIEISHNIYQNRWLGCLWQSYGCRMIPTIAWALPDTYDICFSGVEYGSIVLISTIGCTTHLPEFYQGYNEMMLRINPSIVIVYGDMLPDMYGRFVHFRYTDSFNNQNPPYKQQTLFDISPIFERKRGA